MDNNRLNREVDALKSNTEDVLTMLVSEVEEWEEKYNQEVLKNENLKEKIFTLEERVKDLESEVENWQEINEQNSGG